MMHRPLVSIITPCFNGEKYVRPFFESVLSQSYRDYELIFVNDGSTDKTEEIALEFGRRIQGQGAIFRYIYQENAGQAAAINKGLKIFEGDYLMWMDSDDIMMPNHIEEKVRFLETNPEFGFVLVQGENVDYRDLNKRRSVLKRIKPKEEDTLFEDLIYEKNVVFGPGTIMVRRGVFLSAIPTRSIYESRQGQNWQLMLPIAYVSKCGYLEKVLFKCVAHPDSHSRMHRDFSMWIERLNGFEELLLYTINNIPSMSNEEKEKWRREITIKCARKRLERAYRFFRFGDMTVENTKLKATGYVKTWEDSFVCYWLRGLYRVMVRNITQR